MEIIPPEDKKIENASEPVSTNTGEEAVERETSSRRGVPRGMMLGGTAFLVVLILIGGYAFFLKVPFFETPQEVKEIRVRLGWVHQGQFTGFYVAKERGFYEEVGLSVELLPLDPSQNQIEELERQDVEVSVMEAHQLLAGIDTGANVRAVAVVYKNNPHVLAVREDSEIFGPEDFNGKVVGLSGGEGEGDSLFKLFVEEFGAGEVIYKNLGFDPVSDFQNNAADIIDIYSIDQPFLAEQRGIPLRTIPLEAYGLSTYGDVITVHNDLIATQPDLIEDFLHATFKGWEYAFSYPTEAIDIVLAYAEGSYQDRLYQEHILFESIPLIRGDEKDLGRMNLVPWSTLYESMRRGGALQNEFNVQSVYTNTFVQ